MKSFGVAAFVCAAAFGAAHAQEASSISTIGHAPTDTVVRIELAESLSSATNFKGNTFAIKLAEPIVADGGVIVPAGTPGTGEIISSGHAEMGGKAGKLILAARYLDYKGQHIPLHGLRLARSGNDAHDLRNTTMAVGIVALAPAVGIVGAMTSGDDVSFPVGTQADAKLSTELALPVTGPATKAPERAADAPIFADGIAAPPPGKAQVVFYRTPKYISGHFPIMEGDTTVAKLGNASYLVLPVEPGPHTFRANGKADADSLTLEADVGETFYVEQSATAGAFTAQPLLYPRDQAAFAALKNMKPAAAPKS